MIWPARNVAALADYGTTAATLSALQTRIDVYSQAVQSPRIAKSHVAGLTQLLEKEIRRMDTIQRERLDPLMEQFSDSNEMLYNEYQSARTLVDNKGGGKKTANPPAKPTP